MCGSPVKTTIVIVCVVSGSHQGSQKINVTISPARSWIAIHTEGTSISTNIQRWMDLNSASKFSPLWIISCSQEKLSKLSWKKKGLNGKIKNDIETYDKLQFQWHKHWNLCVYIYVYKTSKNRLCFLHDEQQLLKNIYMYIYKLRNQLFNSWCPKYALWSRYLKTEWTIHRLENWKRPCFKLLLLLLFLLTHDLHSYDKIWLVYPQVSLFSLVRQAMFV